MNDRHSVFEGMTVNERLFAAGLLDQFDAAIHQGDRPQAIALLLQVAMSEDGAGETVDAILAHPSTSGHPSP